MMEKKMKLFGHIHRMPDEKLLKQVVFGIVKGSDRRRRPKKDGQMT